ncbi:MAG: hypothetical protein A2X46_06565 [Lentisphaerae bacterium GWF2_57_35]|nr:MAG: hypothetical protein A2X46_06565 [Lentisphaerae bacterium GWF2_57_35]
MKRLYANLLQPVWMSCLLLGCLPVSVLAQETLYDYETPEPAQARCAAPVFTNAITLSTGVQAEAKDLARARGLIQSDELAEGCALLEKIVEVQPTYIPAWRLLGETYWQNGRQEDAIRLWELLRPIVPSELFVHNSLGDAHRSRNELEPAIEAYRRSLQVDADQPEIVFQLGRVLRWAGHLEEAIAVLQPLCQTHPERIDIKAELARSYLTSRQYDRALPLWNELVEAAPAHAEYETYRTLALFYAGHREEAIGHAQALIRDHPANSRLLSLLADAAEYSGDLFSAATFLEQIYSASGQDMKSRRRILNRLIPLYDRGYGQQAERFPLDRLCELVRGYIQSDPMNADMYLALGDLLVLDSRYEEAISAYRHVLDELNSCNIRAHRGLFELLLRQGDYEGAEQELSSIRRFNPHDPYLYSIQARWYAEQSRYKEAFEALDKLEQSGWNGSLAVLLYHGLSSSDDSEILPVTQFQEQLSLLKEAGFRFITAAQIPGYFEQARRMRELFGGMGVERVACVTFDDARRDAMRLGTPVAEELDLVFSMHVPVGFVEEQHPFISTLDMLKEFEATGHWIMGSHLVDAHKGYPLDAEGHQGYPMANRVWIAEAHKTESEAQYVQRVAAEYGQSRRFMDAYLHTARTTPFVAYPFGDIGQQTVCNEIESVPINLRECGRHYQVGFIQSPFGYAVQGDNPLLYQRIEPHRWENGSNLVVRVLENHPVLLARRLRAEYAARAGKKYLARDNLEALQKDGYPPSSLEKTRLYVERILGRRISLPEPADEDPADPPQRPTVPGTEAPREDLQPSRQELLRENLGF